jgi:hypothetical protein
VSEIGKIDCAYCEQGRERGDRVDRRHFLRLVGSSATALAVGRAAALAAAEPAQAQKPLAPE